MEDWYRSFEARGVAPRFAVGEGQGYTRFELADSRVGLQPDGSAVVELAIRNLGKRPGKAVIQAYLDGVEEDAGVSPLAGWRTVRLTPGEQKQHGWTSALGPSRPGTRMLVDGANAQDRAVCASDCPAAISRSNIRFESIEVASTPASSQIGMATALHPSPDAR